MENFNIDSSRICIHKVKFLNNNQCKKLKNVFIQTNELEIDSFSFAKSPKIVLQIFLNCQKFRFQKLIKFQLILKHSMDVLILKNS